MKLPSILMSIAVVTFFATPSASQSMSEAVFSAAEREIIRGYYGRSAENRQGRDVDSDGDTLSDDEPARQAQKDGNGTGKENGKGKGKGKSAGKSKDMPPGLAAKEELPPGLQQQLEKNGALPPGLEKRELPDDLSGRLPRLKEGLERVIVDGDVVLVDTATNVALDVLYDVLSPGNKERSRE